MSKRSFISITFILILLMAFAGSIACQSAPTPRTGALSLEPIQGKAAAKLKVSGSGFVKDEKVQIKIVLDQYTTVGLAAPDSGGVMVAGPNGTFELQSAIPAGSNPGTYTIAATGDKGTTASAKLVILPK